MASNTYTEEGLKGVLREGGTARRQVVDHIADSLRSRVDRSDTIFTTSNIPVGSEWAGPIRPRHDREEWPAHPTGNVVPFVSEETMKS